MYHYDEQLFNPNYFSGSDEISKTISGIKNDHGLSFTVFKEIPWKLHGYVALAQSQLSLRAPFMDNDLVKIIYQAPEDVHSSSEISLRLISDGNHNLSQISTDRGVGGNSNYLFTVLIK